MEDLQRLARQHIKSWTARHQPEPFNKTDVDQLFKKTKKRSARFQVSGATVEIEDELDWHPGLKENAGLVHRLLEQTSAKLGLPDGLDVVWNMHDGPILRASSAEAARAAARQSKALQQVRSHLREKYLLKLCCDCRLLMVERSRINLIETSFFTAGQS